MNEPEDYPDDITRLVDAYRAHYELPMSRAEAQRAWWRHSDLSAAGWLSLDDYPTDALAIVLRHHCDARFYGAPGADA